MWVRPVREKSFVVLVRIPVSISIAIRRIGHVV